jgi:hypothetical protein
MMTSLHDSSKVRTTVRTGGFTGGLRSVDDDRGPTASTNKAETGGAER